MYAASTILHAGCKVNLYLDILNTREDGYHDLLSVFLPLAEPHDTLIISQAPPGTGLRLTCRDRELAGPENILHRARNAFVRRSQVAVDLDVQLVKRIPIGAGLGGGSSDAATFLHHLNTIADTPLAINELHALATTIGADVPFFLYNRPALVQGVGDVLHPVTIPLAGLHGLLACPGIHVPTAWAYQAWDKNYLRRNTQQGLLTGKVNPDTFTSLPNVFFFNAFEQVVFQAHPTLRAIKEQLLAFGAAGAALSGSGASIFSLFCDVHQVHQSALWLKRHGIRYYTQDFFEQNRATITTGNS